MGHGSVQIASPRRKLGRSRCGPGLVGLVLLNSQLVLLMSGASNLLALPSMRDGCYFRSMDPVSRTEVLPILRSGPVPAAGYEGRVQARSSCGEPPERRAVIWTEQTAVRRPPVLLASGFIGQ